MKTKIELDQDIIKITNTIHQEFSELSKYITEMPGNNSDNEDVNIKNLEDYYHSLEELVNKYAKTHTGAIPEKETEAPILPGLLRYPASEDIYQQSKQQAEINPENLSKRKVPNEREGTRNEKDFKEDMSGDDLDVPGSELDDKQERVGNEDEENNYYSLGGDNHNDLEEDKG
jgi:hypothetical protein